LRSELAQDTRPHLLFLCQTLPFPPDGGAHIRSYHLLRLLSREYRVTALHFYRRATRPTPEHVRSGLDGLKDIAEVEAYPIPQEFSRIRWYWDHIRSVLARRAYTVFTYESRDFARRVRALLSTNEFSLVHVDSLDLAYYLPLLEEVPMVCGHHNIESALLERRAEVQQDPVSRVYMRLQSRFTRAEERRWAPKVSLNITCSPVDSDVLTTLAPNAGVTSIPNGVDTRGFPPSFSGMEGIVFVGGYSWFPNADGMRWFAEDILPLIRHQAPHLPVTWVGRMPAPTGKEFEDRFGITVTGYVDDIRPYVHRAACMIVPLRVGGGTRLKILDGWSLGSAIVSSSVGCEGLDARHDQNILIADSSEEFAQAVLQVVSDAELRERLGRAGRETAETVYDWAVIGDRLLKEYRDLRAASGLPKSSTPGGR